jgi:DNA-binding NarL/FixJ family response regulator
MVDSSSTPLPEDIIVGCRVLIIDDEPLVADATARLLEHWGAIAMVALDVRQAHSLIDGDGLLPDVVLLDLLMRGGDPSTLVAALRQRSASTAIVVCSGRDELVWDFAGRVGADAVVLKIEGPQALRAGLRDGLAATRRRRPKPRGIEEAPRTEARRAVRRNRILNFFLELLRPDIPPAEFEALSMRVAGFSDDVIADKRKITPGSARRLYNRALDHIDMRGDPYGLPRVIADRLAKALDGDASSHDLDGLDWLAALCAAADEAD